MPVGTRGSFVFSLIHTQYKPIILRYYILFLFFIERNIMKKAFFFILLFSVLAIAGMAQTQQQRLQKHVYYFAADSLRGRSAGSADAAKVASYIENEFRQMGVAPLFDSYRYYFALQGTSVVAAELMGAQSDANYCDVVGVIEGSDPVLKNEYIVLGAHYDHLGVKNGKVYNGADDNASGSAAIIEVARQLMEHRSQLKRSVVICAFDAEEIGLYGSKALASKFASAGMIGKVKMMLSIDMVGWLQQGKALRLTGTGTLKGCAKMLDQVADQVGIPVRTSGFESSPFTATDTEPFAKYGVPTLAVTTGLKSPYHKPGDDAELIDYPGLDLVANYITALALRMADEQQPLVPTGRLAGKHCQHYKSFEVAPTIGYISTKMKFPNTMFGCDDQLGLHAGFNANWNFARHFALNSAVLYEYARAPYPNLANPFDAPMQYRQQSVVVPLQLRYHTMGSIDFGVGFGGFYGYRFAGSLSSDTRFDNQHQYGIMWSFEMRTANLFFDFSFYYQLNTLIPQTAGSIVPDALKNGFSFTLGWYLD